MFATVASRVERDNDLPPRAHKLDVYRRVLDGTLYDVQPHQFHEEYATSGEYVPITARAPSVRSGLCRTVVDDSVSLLFGEGRFPSVLCDDLATADAITALVKETRLSRVMADAATRGSVGSVCVWMRVLRERVFFEVLDTVFLTPTWRADAPDTLERVTERYRVRGAALRDAGYAIPDDMLAVDYWFQRAWTVDEEVWFVPQAVAKTTAMQRDNARSVVHRLGFVPMAWMRNPGTSCTGDSADGGCTFRAGIEDMVALDYLLSGAHRAQMYAAAPRLAISGAIDDAARLGPGDALMLDADGKAMLLETTGSATEASLAMAAKLRETALEAMHGNRSNADKLSASQSGRALELLHQPLIWLADHLRVAYGEDGLLRVLALVVQASQRTPITIGNARVRLAENAPLALRWEPWFAPTYEDMQTQAGTLATLRAAGFVSRETSVRVIGPNYDIEDPAAELALIAADEAAADAREVAKSAQVKVIETSPG